MRTWHVLTVVIAIAGSGCEKKLKWKDHRADTFAFVGYTAQVPAGWRDLNDSEEDDLSKLASSLPAGAVTITPEAAVKKFRPTLMFIPASSAGYEPIDCQRIADEYTKGAKAKNSNVTALTFDGEHGCKFQMAAENISARVTMWIHGDKLIFAQCMHADEPNPDVDATCEQVLASVKRKP